MPAPFPTKPSNMGSNVPVQSAEHGYQQAPGGQWMSAQLPSVAVQGGLPMTTNGFSPDPRQLPLNVPTVGKARP